MSGNLLIMGIGSHAVAVDPATGTEIWRTKLKSSSFVTVQEIGDRVFCGAAGELFCLDRATGHKLWHNKLKGLGTGLVAFGAGDTAAAAGAIAAQQAAAAATIAATV